MRIRIKAMALCVLLAFTACTASDIPAQSDSTGGASASPADEETSHEELLPQTNGMYPAEIIGVWHTRPRDEYYYREDLYWFEENGTFTFSESHNTTVPLRYTTGDWWAENGVIYLSAKAVLLSGDVQEGSPHKRKELVPGERIAEEYPYSIIPSEYEDYPDCMLFGEEMMWKMEVNTRDLAAFRDNRWGVPPTAGIQPLDMGDAPPLAEGVTLKGYRIPWHSTDRNIRSLLWLDEDTVLIAASGYSSEPKHFYEVNVHTGRLVRTVETWEKESFHLLPYQDGFLSRTWDGYILYDKDYRQREQVLFEDISTQTMGYNRDYSRMTCRVIDYDAYHQLQIVIRDIPSGTTQAVIDRQYDYEEPGHYPNPIGFLEDESAIVYQNWSSGMGEPAAGGGIISIDTGEITEYGTEHLTIQSFIPGLPDRVWTTNVVMGAPGDYRTVGILDLRTGNHTILPVVEDFGNLAGIDPEEIYATYPILDAGHPVLIHQSVSLDETYHYFLYDLQTQEIQPVFSGAQKNEEGYLYWQLAMPALSPGKDALAGVDYEEDQDSFALYFYQLPQA